MQMRKPGEPIYLRSHLVALGLAILAPVALPRLYTLVIGPLSFGAQFLAGLAIAVGGGISLYVMYRASAKNEP